MYDIHHSNNKFFTRLLQKVLFHFKHDILLYTSLVKSMVTFYIVYESEAQIKKYIQVEKVLIHFKALLTRNEILELSSGRVAADKDTFNKSREEYFIEILHIEKTQNLLMK